MTLMFFVTFGKLSPDVQAHVIDWVQPKLSARVPKQLILMIPESLCLESIASLLVNPPQVFVVIVLCRMLYSSDKVPDAKAWGDVVPG